MSSNLYDELKSQIRKLESENKDLKRRLGIEDIAVTVTLRLKMPKSKALLLGREIKESWSLDDLKDPTYGESAIVVDLHG